MPAPTPVRIQHGNVRDLSILAQAAGLSLARQRLQSQFLGRGGQPVYIPPEISEEDRFPRAEAIVDPVARTRAYTIYGGAQSVADAATAAPEALRSQLDALKQAQARRVANTPTSMADRVSGSPFGDSIRQRLGSGSVSGGGVTVEALPDGTIRGFEQTGPTSRALSEEALARRGGFASPGTPPPSPVEQAKHDLLTNLKDVWGLPDAAVEGLRRAAPFMSPEELLVEGRRLADQLRPPAERSTGEFTERDRVRLQVQDIDRKLRSVREQVIDLSAAFTPDELGMSEAEFIEKAIEDVDASSIPGYGGSREAKIETPEVQAKLNAFRRLKMLQPQLQQLEQQRQTLLTQPRTPGQPATGEDLSQRSTEELLRDLLGG